MIVTCPDCPGAMVPPVGKAASQTNEVGIAAACQLRGLCPLLVMVTTWPVGLGCPWMVLKVRLKGDALIIGAVGGAVWTVTFAITVSVLCPKTNERLA